MASGRRTTMVLIPRTVQTSPAHAIPPPTATSTPTLVSSCTSGAPTAPVPASLPMLSSLWPATPSTPWPFPRRFPESITRSPCLQARFSTFSLPPIPRSPDQASLSPAATTTSPLSKSVSTRAHKPQPAVPSAPAAPTRCGSRLRKLIRECVRRVEHLCRRDKLARIEVRCNRRSAAFRISESHIAVRSHQIGRIASQARSLHRRQPWKNM